VTLSPSLTPLSEAVFGALLEAVPDPRVCTAADGRITLLNAQAERLFGYSVRN